MRTNWVVSTLILVALTIASPGQAQTNEPTPAPEQPVPFGGRAGTGPGQAENAAAQRLPDLTLSTLEMGHTTIDLDGDATATLAARTFGDRSKPPCEFPTRVGVHNVGREAPASSAVIIVDGKRPGAPGRFAVPRLGADEKAELEGPTLTLAPGEHTLRIRLDVAQTIEEIDELNNTREVHLTVLGKCSQ